jgi:hypothetical protein
MDFKNVNSNAESVVSSNIDYMDLFIFFDNS